MNSVIAGANNLPAMSTADVEKVRRLESHLLEQEQVTIQTVHHFHAGMYSRTIRIPAGVVITGALIKIATMLIVSGHTTVFIGGETLELCGYHLLPGQAGRKQVFFAHADTDLTMIFPTQARTVEQAEAEFTEETNMLMSRQQGDDLIFTAGA